MEPATLVPFAAGADGAGAGPAEAGPDPGYHLAPSVPTVWPMKVRTVLIRLRVM